MGDFIFEANEKYEALEESIQKVENDQKELRDLFGEDEFKFQISSFMADCGQFLINFDDALLEIEKKKKVDASNAEKAKKKREQQKLEKEKNIKPITNNLKNVKINEKKDDDEDDEEKDDEEEEDEEEGDEIDKKIENSSKKNNVEKGKNVVDDIESDLYDGNFKKKKREIDLDKLADKFNN